MAQHVRVQDVEMVALGGLGMRCTEALHCAQRCQLRLPGRERGLRERVCSRKYCQVCCSDSPKVSVTSPP